VAKKMSVIEKKTWPDSFKKILNGQKTYDLRLADWECEPGDILVLKEYIPETKNYTGREIRKKVGYVGKTKDWTYFTPEEVEQYGYQVISLIDEGK
jgi:hypothetical protein